MGNRLKVLLITPSYLPDATGNAVTAHRLYVGLTARGMEVQVAVPREIELFKDFRPDVIHALHALKGGVAAMKLAEELGVPYGVTATGTDVNIDLMQVDGRVFRVLQRASLIAVYSELTKERLKEIVSMLGKKIRVIYPAVHLERAGNRSQQRHEGIRFFLPSGIRPVKNPTFAIRPLERLRESHPGISLVVAGAILSGDEWKRFSGDIRERSWVLHKAVRHEDMSAEYMVADVVLNTSLSEGLSNAVLEAMFMGLPVLASDCEGNRSVITDGVDGFLYRQGDEDDFMEQAMKLVSSASLRSSLGDLAKKKVLNEYGIEDEITEHIKFYEEMLCGV